jgi:hypothetical protein
LEGGKWRASKNEGWEGEFEGVCKLEVYLEALLELGFCTKPPNSGVEDPTGVALRATSTTSSSPPIAKK